MKLLVKMPNASGQNAMNDMDEKTALPLTNGRAQERCMNEEEFVAEYVKLTGVKESTARCVYMFQHVPEQPGLEHRQN